MIFSITCVLNSAVDQEDPRWLRYHEFFSHESKITWFAVSQKKEFSSSDFRSSDHSRGFLLCIFKSPSWFPLPHCKIFPHSANYWYDPHPLCQWFATTNCEPWRTRPAYPLQNFCANQNLLPVSKHLATVFCWTAQTSFLGCSVFASENLTPSSAIPGLNLNVCLVWL